MESQKPPKAPKPGRNQMLAEALHVNHAEKKTIVSKAKKADKNRPGQVDILDFIRSLLEQCIQKHMSRDEAVRSIAHYVSIDPGAISGVWQQLEKDNPEFFKSYYLRLKLIKQIKVFNELLQKQAQLNSTSNSVRNNTLSSPFYDGRAHIPVNSFRGYPPQQLPYAPYVGPPGMQSLNNELLDNMEHEVLTSDNPTPLRECIDALDGFKQDLAESCPSAELNGQFSFLLDDIEMDVNMQSIPGIQFAPDFDSGFYGISGDNLSSDSVVTEISNHGDSPGTSEFQIDYSIQLGGGVALVNYQQPLLPLMTNNFLDQHPVLPPFDTASANLHDSADGCTGDKFIADAPDPGSQRPN